MTEIKTFDELMGLTTKFGGEAKGVLKLDVNKRQEAVVTVTDGYFAVYKVEPKGREAQTPTFRVYEVECHPSSPYQFDGKMLLEIKAWGNKKVEYLVLPSEDGEAPTAEWEVLSNHKYRDDSTGEVDRTYTGPMVTPCSSPVENTKDEFWVRSIGNCKGFPGMEELQKHVIMEQREGEAAQAYVLPSFLVGQTIRIGMGEVGTFNDDKTGQEKTYFGPYIIEMLDGDAAAASDAPSDEDLVKLRDLLADLPEGTKGQDAIAHATSNVYGSKGSKADKAKMMKLLGDWRSLPTDGEWEAFAVFAD